MGDTNTKYFRWAICGTGKITERFMRALDCIPNTQVVACASASKDRAREFGIQHGLVPYTYQELVEAADIDAVYVCTNNHLHYPCTLQLLQHHKPVLVEKPFAVDSTQAQDMIALAKHHKTLLMEAMWTAYLPCVHEIERLISNSSMGDTIDVASYFCIPQRDNLQHRIFNKEYAGGVVLDLGVYFVSLSYQLFGRPMSIKCKVQESFNGVETSAKIVLEYNGFSATGVCAVGDSKDCYYNIKSSNGTIHMPDFNGCNRYEIHDKYGKVTQHAYETDVEQFVYQIRYFMDLHVNGKLESDIYPLRASQDIMDILTECKSQISKELN
ncbi:MAG: Gfo/Idh/MocA family oxidoreductase [Clostridiales bacterium]|jgi:predicted dehydrogenase|nr:Gfo/Idh/MocA family oxidoreductase [Clostridiales bacterium]